jgi:murein DD-endopeptidase MepM/ murein hydrolase activator NlpD
MIKKGILFISAFSFTMVANSIITQNTYANNMNNVKNVSWTIENDQLNLEKDLSSDKFHFRDRVYRDVYTVQSGDTIKSILRKSQIDPIDIKEFIHNTEGSNKFFDLKIGQEMTIERDQNNFLSKITINKDDLNILQAKKDTEGKFNVVEKEKDFKYMKKYVSGTINSSLSSAGRKAGLDSNQINQLVNIFSWDIDFKYDIQSGDTFSLVYEQKIVDDKVVGTGKILGAEFNLSGKKYSAYLFEKDGIKKYYNEKGESLEKAFIRNPIDFARISSTFNPKRVHPIFKKIRPHNGTDYSAKIGTPIKTTGDGFIEFIGTQNGYGNVIIVNHGQGYSTLYAHMNGFKKGLKKGSKVSQSDVIGYVGMTGYSTGPHLHYEFKINGIAKNSLSVDLPIAQPLNKKDLSTFKQSVAYLNTNMQMTKNNQVETNNYQVAQNEEYFE